MTKIQICEEKKRKCQKKKKWRQKIVQFENPFIKSYSNILSLILFEDFLFEQNFDLISFFFTFFQNHRFFKI